ncbi:MAG: hypothetical protein ACXVRJ_12655 [Gaiellaceae bacterium]
MLHLLALALIAGCFALALVLAISVLSGWRLSDARQIVVNHAFHEFIEEGERIPGAAPGLLARTLIALFAARGDPRRTLIPDEHPVLARKPVRVLRESRDPDESVWL